MNGTLPKFYSCGSSDSTGFKTSEVALSEYAFKNDASLHAQFSHVTVVDFEHTQETNINEKDSGSPGVDIIPFMVIFGQNHTFEFEDNGNGNHYAILRNENEEEVARIDANGTPVAVYLLDGKYKLYLHNMGNETVPLFLQPVIADGSSNIQASFNPIQLAKFLFTHSCAGCDLSYALLAYLPLEGSNLSHANLSHTNLRYANLISAQLLFANLSGADLTDVNLTYANLSHANLTGAQLLFANLSYANLTGANLSYANLTGAGLVGATWIDGHHVCGDGSVGRCIY